MADENNPLAAFGLGQITNVKVQDALAAHVNKCFEEAKQHKNNTGITSRLLRNLRAKRCEYQPEEKALLGEYNDIYIGIAALKARAAESWLIDIIVNNIEKPWTLNTTPEPELPDRLKEQVIDALMVELPQFNSFEALKDRAEQLKSAVQKIAAQKAEATTQRMEKRIEDQLMEGGWVETFGGFVSDLTVYPTALVRGPIEIGAPEPRWNGDKFEVKHKSILTTRVISPFNAFPAPNASTAQNGSYFIEAVEYTHSDLHNLIGVPSFSSGNIRQVLEDYSEGYAPTRLETSEQKSLQDKEQNLNTVTGLEVRIYNGKVEGKMLADNGVLVEDLQKFYECEVWVIGTYVVRAVLNPDPLGKRPIFSTSYTKVNGSFWGQSVIDLVYDTMRVCNAAARSVVRNMGYSSGPIGEVIADRVDDDVTDITPYKIFQVGPDMTGTGAPAFRWHNVGSVADQLMLVFEKFMKMADDLSGVPAYVLGNPQVAGAGRTLGGLSMLMGNAAKGIKNVQLNIDRDIITGVVTAFYQYNMITSKDDGIKADAKVVARGATGLLQRELAQTRTVEVLQLLTPYLQQGLIDKETIQYILREILKNTGLDVDKAIPDPYKSEGITELANLLGGAATEAMESGDGNAVDLPPQSIPRQLPQLASIPTPINLAQGA